MCQLTGPDCRQAASSDLPLLAVDEVPSARVIQRVLPDDGPRTDRSGWLCAIRRDARLNASRQGRWMGKRSISEGDLVVWHVDGVDRSGRVRPVVRHPRYLGPVEATPPTVPDDKVMVEVVPTGDGETLWLPASGLAFE